ncbi:MAG: hypothetical protein E7080_04515 [Bacteroidales bacterium]|nr:hypothetical protein [Bacteroidales bacterium]
MDLTNYIKLDTNSDFMVDLFMFSTTQNIKSTIEYGVPVIVRFGNCYITVVGILYDGDIVYANHDNGNLYAVEKDYFNNYENIVIGCFQHLFLTLSGYDKTIAKGFFAKRILRCANETSSMFSFGGDTFSLRLRQVSVGFTERVLR